MKTTEPITVEEARRIIAEAMPVGRATTIPLNEANNRVLSEDVRSPFDSPRFDSSAMDGYAIRHEEAPGTLTVIETIAAGDVSRHSVQPGQAIRIMTGGMVPTGATAVIRQEDVVVKDQQIQMMREVKKGENIRRQGDELHVNDVALPKGSVLTSGAIGFLASLGMIDVSVSGPPRVALLPTGNELVQRANELVPGKILDVSSWSLPSCLKLVGVLPVIFSPAGDQRNILIRAIENALQGNDILIITGGVSVGEFDLVKDILAELKFEPLFWQVWQKPGMPLLLARRGKQFVFGLPGNPASSLVCCYEYVLPAIKIWLEFKNPWPREERANMGESFLKKDGKTHFVRASAERRDGAWWVSFSRLQGSHMMQAFAVANCLLVVPSEREQMTVGDDVMIHWLE